MMGLLIYSTASSAVGKLIWYIRYKEQKDRGLE